MTPRPIKPLAVPCTPFSSTNCLFDFGHDQRHSVPRIGRTTSMLNVAPANDLPGSWGAAGQSLMQTGISLPSGRMPNAESSEIRSCRPSLRMRHQGPSTDSAIQTGRRKSRMLDQLLLTPPEPSLESQQIHKINEFKQGWQISGQRLPDSPEATTVTAMANSQ